MHTHTRTRRVDALTLACCNPRTTVLPTELELEVAAEAVRLTLRQALTAACAAVCMWSGTQLRSRRAAVSGSWRLGTPVALQVPHAPPAATRYRPCRCPNSSLKHKVLGPLGRLLMRIRASVAALLSRDRKGTPATLQGGPPSIGCTARLGCLQQPCSMLRLEATGHAPVSRKAHLAALPAAAHRLKDSGHRWPVSPTSTMAPSFAHPRCPPRLRVAPSPPGTTPPHPHEAPNFAPTHAHTLPHPPPSSPLLLQPWQHRSAGCTGLAAPW